MKDLTDDLICADEYPLDMDDYSWRLRRGAQLEGMGLSGQEILLRMGRELMARAEALQELRRDQVERRARRTSRRTPAADLPVAEHIRRRIAAERIFARRTQAQLARAIGLTQRSLSDIERGRRRLTADEIFLIAEELGQPVEVFMPAPPAKSAG